MPIVKKYKSEIVSVDNPVEGLYKVSFRSEKKFNYLPGQFLHLAIDEYDGIGQWPDSRCFSMQSNPDEIYITITYSVKGVFTRKMKDVLSPGKEVWLKLPYGDIFQRDHKLENCVFIAGGTGITPFLSLFSHQSFEAYKNPKLYLGFREEKYNLYDSELKKIKNISAEIRIFYEKSDGVLDIKRIFGEVGQATYFLSGPPLMLTTFRNELRGLGIPESEIVTDDWE